MPRRQSRYAVASFSDMPNATPKATFPTGHRLHRSRLALLLHDDIYSIAARFFRPILMRRAIALF